jgi:hypothetical protein
VIQNPYFLIYSVDKSRKTLYLVCLGRFDAIQDSLEQHPDSEVGQGVEAMFDTKDAEREC